MKLFPFGHATHPQWAMAAGLVLAQWGPSWAFLVNAVSFAAVVAALMAMRTPPFVPEPDRQSVMAEFADGVRYARRQLGIIVAAFSALALGTGVAVLGSTHAGRPGLAVAVSKDLTARVHAGDLVRELASIIDGNGGGSANSATGGGKDAARLGDALDAGARAVKEKLGGRG